MHNSQQYWHHL